MTERCFIGLDRVSEEKHNFAVPKTTLKPFVAEQSEPKVRCHINCTYRDVNKLQHYIWKAGSSINVDHNHKCLSIRLAVKYYGTES